jgi:hypothetical protein
VKPHLLGTSIAVVLTTAASGLALAPATISAAAVNAICVGGSSYSGTTIDWTGKGDGHSWDIAANWSPAIVPDVDQLPATYQTQFACIGDNRNGKPANVTIPAADAHRIAGIDVGDGAQLTVAPGAGLFLGAANAAAVIPSTIDAGSTLQLQAATLGGNAPLSVAGTLRLTAEVVKGHKDVATLTGDNTAGSGLTTIASRGKVAIDGVKFGGVYLAGRRSIDNSGTITFTHFGFLAMNNGTSLIDERHSSLALNGDGGIYRGVKDGATAAPKIRQLGAITRDGKDSGLIADPVVLPKKTPKVTVRRGTLALQGAVAPKASVDRKAGYGLGSCDVTNNQLCKQTFATSGQPQAAVVVTSSAGPKVSKIAVSLVKAPAKLHGHKVIGQGIEVTAPTKHTTHSTHMTFIYDATVKGLTSKPKVYRGSHAITLCQVHGLTATNTSCVLSEGVAHSGDKDAKGDLTIVVISIQPNARWLATR